MSDEILIRGVQLFDTMQNSDPRGYVSEIQYKEFISTKSLKRILLSVSAKNVLRGLHLASRKIGQEKVITCVSGQVLDVVVDLRVESDTFLQYQFLNLNSLKPQNLIISSGIAHGFLSLTEESIMLYQLNTEYDPDSEITINPFDPKLGINWPSSIPYVLSPKDANGTYLDARTIIKIGEAFQI